MNSTLLTKDFISYFKMEEYFFITYKSNEVRLLLGGFMKNVCGFNNVKEKKTWVLHEFIEDAETGPPGVIL